MNNVYIDDTVVIGENCLIDPNVMIKGNTVIGDNSEIHFGSYIEDTVIGKNNKIYSSYIVKSEIGDNNLIGPYTHIREGNKIGNNNEIFSYVQLKNNEIGDHVKIHHLSYLGDSFVSDNVNIGAGVVTANYDGKNKHKTHMKEQAFVGCNSVLVAPVTLEHNSFIAAGSVITKDVPANTLAIARERQINKDI